MSDLINTKLGQYELVEITGCGGMATVYKAHQSALDRYVAIKVLLQNRDPQFAARFKNEARAIARLEHPNILPIYDYGEQDGLLYLVLRHIENGATLAHLLGQPMAVAQALRLVISLLGALDYAHQHGVIHRDIKPSNVLMPSPTQPMLTDFGIAKLLNSTDTRLTIPGLIVGTPVYMAPEQATGRPVDARTDIYSTGVMLYEMVTGQVPFDDDTPMAVLTRHAYEAPPSPRLLNPDLSPLVEAALLRALAKDPDDRFQSAADMAQALELVIGRLDQSLYQAGVRAFEEGHWNEAIKQFGELVERNPAYEDAGELLEAARKAQERAGSEARQQLETVRQSARRLDPHVFRDIGVKEVESAPEQGLAMEVESTQKLLPDRFWIWIVVIWIVVSGAITLLLNGLLFSPPGLPSVPEGPGLSELVMALFVSAIGLWLWLALPFLIQAIFVVWTIELWPWNVLALLIATALVCGRALFKRFGVLARSARHPAPATDARTDLTAAGAPSRALAGAGPQPPAPLRPSMIFRQQAAVEHARPTAQLRYSEVISRLNQPVVEELILHQDYERLWRFIAHAQSGRYLLTGYGPFGATSLMRGALEKARSELQSSGAPEGALLAFYFQVGAETPDGFEITTDHFRFGHLQTRFGSGHTAQLEALQSRAIPADTRTTSSLGRLTFALKNPLGATFFGKPGRVAEANEPPAGSDYSFSTLVTDLGEFLEHQGDPTALRNIVLRLAGSDVLPSRIVIIVDRIRYRETFEALSRSELFGNRHILFMVVARKEDFDLWVAGERRVEELGFRKWYVPCLWKIDLDRVLFQNVTTGENPAFAEFQKHLEFVSRGSLGNIIAELRNSKEIFHEPGQGFVDLSNVGDEIRHNAWAQAVLERNWDAILGNLFAGKYQTEKEDRARIAVYHLIDWIARTNRFTLEQVLEQAHRRHEMLPEGTRRVYITISDDEQIVAETITNLLRVLEHNRYIEQVNGQYRVIWSNKQTRKPQRAIAKRQRARSPASNAAPSSASDTREIAPPPAEHSNAEAQPSEQALELGQGPQQPAEASFIVPPIPQHADQAPSPPSSPSFTVSSSGKETIVSVTIREAQAAPEGEDVFAAYEAGLRQLLHRLGPDHPDYGEALTYQQRLLENLSRSRRFGNTEMLRAERAEILAQLNALALARLNVAFSQLSGTTK